MFITSLRLALKIANNVTK